MIKRIAKKNLASIAWTDDILNQSREAKKEEIKENKKKRTCLAVALFRASSDFEKEHKLDKALKKKGYNDSNS